MDSLADAYDYVHRRLQDPYVSDEVLTAKRGSAVRLDATSYHHRQAAL